MLRLLKILFPNFEFKKILVNKNSPPGSSVHGIFQARVLEWGAIAFSDYGL